MLRESIRASCCFAYCCFSSYLLFLNIKHWSSTTGINWIFHRLNKILGADNKLILDDKFSLKNGLVQNAHQILYFRFILFNFCVGQKINQNSTNAVRNQTNHAFNVMFQRFQDSKIPVSFFNLWERHLRKCRSLASTRKEKAKSSFHARC